MPGGNAPPGTGWPPNRNRSATPGRVTNSAVQALPTDGIGEGSDYAEVYESISFYVASDGNPPVISADTPWEFSSVVSIHE